ncbi:MAG: hypothetical protein HY434_00330 [Candidatus Liptonbacteria bacterium]|nr:hypothetical protein [Candidatus Liptonbacteria bacterium]
MANLKFWKPNEEFLLLEILPTKAKGVLLNIDTDKNIRIAKRWENFELKKLDSPLRRMTRGNLIVAADPTLAASLDFPMKIKRDGSAADRPITPAELDAALSQSIDKSFNHLRSAASARLKADELDTILVGIKAAGFKIDGHALFNPVGFPGKYLDLVLRLTFATRPMFEAFKDYFSARDGFFFASSVDSIANTIARLAEGANFLMLRPERSCVVWRDKQSGAFRERDLEWSFADFLESIASRVPIQEEPGAENFLGGRFVFEDQGVLQPIIKSHLRNLAKELRGVNKNKVVYARLSEPLPLSLPRKEGGIVFDALPLKSALGKFGFGCDISGWRIPEDDVFLVLAPFFDYYHHRGDSEIHRGLRRKINWLVS